MLLKYKKSKELAKEPTKGHENDAGFDLYYCGEKNFYMEPNSVSLLETGIHFEIPAGYYGQLLTRSSMAAKGLVVLGGVIDSGYTGEVKVLLYNSSDQPLFVESGAKVAQIIFFELPSFTLQETSSFASTSRGDGGFGSTGA